MKKAAVMGLTFLASACYSQQVSDIQYIEEAPEDWITWQMEKTAEQVRKASPSRLDDTLVSLGANYSRTTKTLTYQHESHVPLHEVKAREYVRGFVCASNLRRAFMRRGVTFSFAYQTPRGVLTYPIRNGDCR